MIDPGGVPPAATRSRVADPRLVVLAIMAVACLAIAIVAGAVAHTDLVRSPTAAQRAAAAAEAVADRWRSWPAGRIFPATLSYSTSLLTAETASRVAIAADATCPAAVESRVVSLALREQCSAGLRATYVDQLQGVLYTVGVLAFPDARRAAAFAANLHAAAADSIPLRALALPGTASALFSPAAAQAGTVRQSGPFVVLTAAGYADGEPAGHGQEPRPSVFAPAGQLAGEIIASLVRPVTVSCTSPEWTC
jgi:hypothetical protein